MREKPKTGYAPVYCALYPELAIIARKHGYGMAVLGSMLRDFDLVCIPWVETVSTPEEVVKEICATFAIRRIGTGGDLKKHGRLAHTISVEHGDCALDLSFMPVAVKAVDSNDTMRMDFMGQWHQFPDLPKGKGGVGRNLFHEQSHRWKLVAELGGESFDNFREACDAAMRKLGLLEEAPAV